MMAYLMAKKSREKINSEDEKHSNTFLLSKLRQSAEYKRWLREHAEVLRTYSSDYRGLEERRGHRDTSPAEEW